MTKSRIPLDSCARLLGARFKAWALFSCACAIGLLTSPRILLGQTTRASSDVDVRAAQGTEHAGGTFAVGGERGYGFESNDGANLFYTHWLAATDFQTFLGMKPPGLGSRDTFVVRLAAVQLDAVLHRIVHSQILVDFSQSKLTLYDAWVQIRIADWLSLRLGKFQFPINEERLTPLISLPFVNTGFASFLLPNRDTGVQVLGEVADGKVTYNLTLVNGAYAGVMSETDVDSNKDVIGRIFVRPFRETKLAALRKLGFGLGGSYGSHIGTADTSALPVLRTYGGQTFFAYRTTTRANGEIARVVPHATWGWGPFAAYSDYVRTIERVSSTLVTSDGWSIVPSVVLTGEDASPLTFIIPKHPLDLSSGHIGTVLVLGGAGEIQVSSTAFHSAADPATAMQRAKAFGAGVNWYPFSGIAILLQGGHMVFDGFKGAPARPAESSFIGRFEMVL